MKLIFLIVIVLLTFGLYVTIVNAQCSGELCHFTPSYLTDDVYIYDGNGEVNDNEFQMKWNISGLFCPEYNVTSANLTVYINYSDGGGSDINITYIRNQTWTEDISLADYIQITEHESLDGVFMNGTSEDTFVSINITNALIEACNRGDDNFTVRIEDANYITGTPNNIYNTTSLRFGHFDSVVPANSNFIDFDSKDYEISTRNPVLDVEYTKQNLTLLNVSDSVVSMLPGGDVTFTAYWDYADTDAVIFLVDDTIGFTNCDYYTQTGCLCAASPSTTNTSTCQYTASGDIGNITWYGRVCTLDNACTDVYIEYNYSGVFNPGCPPDCVGNASEGHRIFTTTGTVLPPTVWITGSQITTENYTKIAESDNTLWHYDPYVANEFEIVRFRILANTSTTSMLSPTSINYMRISHEGYGSTEECDSDGLYLYVWNVTSASWEEYVDVHSGGGYGAQRFLLEELDHTANYSDYINQSDGHINFIVTTKNHSLDYQPPCGAGESSIFTDHAFVNLTIGGNFEVVARDFQIILELNSTDPNVYIPGVGEVSAGSLGSGTDYTSPTHYYLASYIGNALTALVTHTGKDLFVSNETDNHTIQVSQRLQPIKPVFITFTPGDWNDVEKRMSLIEVGDFLDKITPTFGFGLGNLYPIKIILEYTNLDIRNHLELRRGTHDLVIDYNDTTSDNKPALFIK